MQEWEEHATGFPGNNFPMAPFLLLEAQGLMHNTNVFTQAAFHGHTLSEVFNTACSYRWAHIHVHGHVQLPVTSHTTGTRHQASRLSS